LRLSLARSCAAVTLALTVTACASTGNPRTTEASRDVVTSIEINATTANSAYDLINRLRPNWLRSMGPGSMGGGVRTQEIVVYLDDSRLGGLDALRSLSTAGIRSMRFLDATRAATVLHNVGSEPIAGAIVISTK
jgi:hypothetical protein